jgi:hypothetical protein
MAALVPSAGTHSRGRFFAVLITIHIPQVSAPLQRATFSTYHGRNIMNRRTTITLTTMALLGLAVATALPQAGFAQSNPLVGTWKLNLAKSKFSPGPPPRSLTLTYQQDGQNIRSTAQGVDAQGNPVPAGVLMHIYDGQPHPSTGNPDYDASAYTRVDANTLIFSRLKAGKLIATGTIVMSQDGKTLTVNTTGLGSTPGADTAIGVFDKQ